VTFIERVVYLEDNCVKRFVCGIEIPDGNWIGGVVQETGSCDEICIRVLFMINILILLAITKWCVSWKYMLGFEGNLGVFLLNHPRNDLSLNSHLHSQHATPHSASMKATSFSSDYHQLTASHPLSLSILLALRPASRNTQNYAFLETAWYDL